MRIMQFIWRPLFLLTVLLLIGAAPANLCHELAELNMKYAAQKQLYDAAISKQRGLPADLRQSIRMNKGRRRQIVFALLREAEGGGLQISQGCCQEKLNDQVVRWVCVMANYLKDRDSAKLIQDMPMDQAGIDALFELDMIFGFAPPDESAEVPKTFRGQSFSGYTIERIYERVLEKDEIAMSRFLSLLTNPSSKSEGLEEMFAQLVIHHSEVVLARWPTIQKFEKKIHVSTTDFASSSSDVLGKYAEKCKQQGRSSQECTKVQEFLKRLAAEK